MVVPLVPLIAPVVVGWVIVRFPCPFFASKAGLRIVLAALHCWLSPSWATAALGCRKLLLLAVGLQVSKVPPWGLISLSQVCQEVVWLQGIAWVGIWLGEEVVRPARVAAAGGAGQLVAWALVHAEEAACCWWALAGAACSE